MITTKAQRETVERMRRVADARGDWGFAAMVEENGDILVSVRNSAESGDIMRWRIWRDGVAEVI